MRLVLKLGDEERIPAVKQSWNRPDEDVHHHLVIRRLWGVMLPEQWRWGWPTIFIGVATFGGVTVCTPRREDTDGL